MNGCAVLNARSAHEQLSRVQEVLCDSLKRLTEDKNQLPRKVRKELTRIKTCMDAQAVALAAQKKSIAKIHDAGPSSYVHDVLDVHRKRTEREVSAQEPGHDNESGMSTYDEMLKWGKRKNVTDIAEAATPCRNAGREPPKKSARGRNGHTSQRASSAMVEMCMQEPLDTYVKRLMELDPEVPRTAEQCVLMCTSDEFKAYQLNWAREEEQIKLRKGPFRFAVGSRVECCVGNDTWSPGSVKALFYREDNWEPEQFAPYQIALDDGDLIYAPADVEQCIRAAC